MDDLKRLLIERDCVRLLYEFGNIVDNDGMAATRLFSDDCLLVLTFRGVTISGREDIEAFYKNQRDAQVAGRHLVRHMLSSPIIDVKDSGHAVGQTLVTLYRSAWDMGRGPAPNAHPVIFYWDDEFVRTSEGWRISKHICSQFAFAPLEAMAWQKTSELAWQKISESAQSGQ